MITFSQKRYIIISLITLAMISCEISQVKKDNKPLKKIEATTSKKLLSAEAFNEKINKDSKGIILDVRTDEEFNEGHLKNAILINFLNDNFEEKINQLEKNKTIYLYCRSGNRSAKAAEILIKNGFQNIYELDGGIMAWENNRLPLEN